MTEKLELPTLCYSEHPVTREIIKIVRGMEGYYPLEDSLQGKSAKELNESIGITDLKIVRAMKVGSMYGWDVPGANPSV